MKDWIQVEEGQKEICRKQNVDWTPLDKKLMVAVNESLFTDIQPVNGLRHLKLESIDGWYLWSGEEIPQDDNSFFKPIHTEHLIEKKRSILKYLGLPAGWRFQIDDKGYEDMWFDESLLIDQ